MIFKGLAKAFGVHVDELAEMMGVTRQTLYDLSHGNYKTPPRRMTAALKAVRCISREMYEKDIEEAEARRIARDAELNRLEDLHGKGVI